MGIGTICFIETGIVVVLLSAGAIAAGLIFLSHYLKLREADKAMDIMKNRLFPEMEAMTDRMMNNVVETTIKASTDMMKRLQEDL